MLVCFRQKQSSSTIGIERTRSKVELGVESLCWSTVQKNLALTPYCILQFVYGQETRQWKDKMNSEMTKPAWSRADEEVVISMIENLTDHWPMP